MSQNKTVLTVIAVLLLGIFVVLAANSVQRTPGEKISDGVHDIGQGIGDSVHRATH